ncbi:hypothetical protein AtEden1_Chr5g0129451 [Arabidopsis thaliana]
MRGREMANNLGLMILLLVIVLVSCSKSSDCTLASPQKSRPSSEWRRKLIPVRSSRSPRSPSFAPKKTAATATFTASVTIITTIKLIIAILILSYRPNMDS